MTDIASDEECLPKITVKFKSTSETISLDINQTITIAKVF